jgi:phage regulator Rha-like protein
MMEKELSVNGRMLPVREYHGQRVVTMRDIAEVHDVNHDQIRRNFNRNRERFEKGLDYYTLKRKDIEVVKLSRAKIRTINVFTESGYLMLVKSLTDDLSWKVQRKLVTSYFKTQAAIAAPVQDENTPVKLTESQQKELLMLMPMAIQELYRYRTYNRLTQADTAIIMNISINAVKYVEARFAEIGIDIPRNHKPRICNMWGV